MEYRKDTQGNSISLLGFGCMRLPQTSPHATDIDYGLGRAMVEYAYEHGVNYFDTAYPYHDGKSEVFIGEALRGYPRASFFLADKMPTWLIRSGDDAKRLFEEQLQRCQVAYFDAYLCHAIGQSDSDFAKKYEKTGALEYLLRQKEEGRIRRLGFSFHGTPERLAAILSRQDWDFAQIQLNYLDWDLIQSGTLYAMLAERAIPCLVMEPVRGGSLHTLCEESIRILQAANPQRSTASWAIRFAASLPHVLTVLSGMSTLEQLHDNVATLENFQPLTPAERQILDQVCAAYLATGAIACTTCRYCMDCPNGVDIPGVFGAYNRCAASLGLPVFVSLMHHANKNAQAFLAACEELPEANRAHNCTACGHCLEHCPQHIDIPEKMQLIAGLYKELRGRP